MRILALSLLSLAALGVQAAPWSLDSCISYAVEHNISVQQRNAALLQSEIEVTAAKDRFLPNLSGYGSQNYSFGRGLTANNTYANRNTASTSVGAQLSVPVFQGLAAIRNLEYARTSRSAAAENVLAAKDDIHLNVMAQYLQVLYAKENLNLALLKLDISRQEEVRRRTLLEAGKIPELDLAQARAQVAQDELARVTAENDCRMALLDLAQMLNLPDGSDFDILNLEDMDAAVPAAEEVLLNALGSNHAVKGAQLSQQAADQQVKVAQSGYIPTLSFSAGLGTNYYRTNGMQNESFGTQFRHNFAESVGFSLSVPIFDAFNTRNSVRRAKVQSVTASLQLAEIRNNLRKAIEQAHAQCIAAADRHKSATVAVEASHCAFEAMKIKYEYGKANATEFETAQNNYSSALATQLQAKYEKILRARILQFYNR